MGDEGRAGVLEERVGGVRVAVEVLYVAEARGVEGVLEGLEGEAWGWGGVGIDGDTERDGEVCNGGGY